MSSRAEEVVLPLKPSDLRRILPAGPIAVIVGAFIVATCGAGTSSSGSPPTVTSGSPGSTTTRSPSPTTGRVQAPVIGQWHELLWHDVSGRVVLVNGGPEEGGRPGDRLEIWSWDGAAWIRLASDPTGPVWRNFGVAAYDVDRDVIVVHGGAASGQKPSDETWEWDGQAWRLASTGGPGAREGSAMAYDRARRRMILFSGAVGGSVLGDTWAFDGAAWARLAETGPRARFPALFASTSDGVLLYGGHVVGDSNRISLADTWLWKGAGWNESDAESPPGPRVNAAAALDPRTGQILLIGGGVGDETRGDVWAWNGFSWLEIDSDAFPPRQGHGAALDAGRDVVVLTGGLDRPVADSPVQDVWEWSGSAAATRVYAGGG